jgi:hypothetical protein
MDVKVGHFRRYRKSTLVALIATLGMEVSEARYVDSVGFVATLLYKWFGNSSGTISPASVKAYDRLAFPISRIADRFFGSFLGKNLVVVASKRG